MALFLNAHHHASEVNAYRTKKYPRQLRPIFVLMVILRFGPNHQVPKADCRITVKGFKLMKQFTKTSNVRLKCVRLLRE